MLQASESYTVPSLQASTPTCMFSGHSAASSLVSIPRMPSYLTYPTLLPRVTSTPHLHCHFLSSLLTLNSFLIRLLLPTRNCILCVPVTSSSLIIVLFGTHISHHPNWEQKGDMIKSTDFRGRQIWAGILLLCGKMLHFSKL